MRRKIPRFAVVVAVAGFTLATPVLAQQDGPPRMPAPGLGVEGLRPDAVKPDPLKPEAAPGTANKSPPPAKQQSAKPVPQDRDGLLAELYMHLGQAQDASQAAPIAETIEGLWLQSGSDTIGVLMGRSAKAINDQKNALALQLLDAVVELAPDYAEGWNRRAYVYYLQNDFEHAIGDLRRALALEPNHFKALEGLARILRESGQKKSALEAYKQILRINPYLEGAKQAADELSVEVEGQGI
jgi:tetratricopeptide (TPR) repeat protein